MNPQSRAIVPLLLALVAAVPAAAGVHAAPPFGGGVEFFEKKVRPVLVNQCYTCHSANTNSKGACGSTTATA